MRVVLSRPYAGALYWFFRNHDYPESKTPTHPYYRHLYGDVDRHLDMALACAVIFDEIVLAAADSPYPHGEHADDYRRVRIPELKLTADWDPVSAGRALAEEAGRDLLLDEQVRQVLRHVPTAVKSYVIADVMADVLLMRKYEAPLVSSSGRRALVLRLQELGALPMLHTNDVTAPARSSLGASTLAALSRSASQQLQDYVSVTGLMFTAQDVRTLGRIKENPRVRRYAGSFQQVITQSGGTMPELYEAIAQAWTSRDLTVNISAGFSTTSRGLSVLGLIPGVGTVTELVGMGADAAALAAEKRVERQSWFELGPEIKRLDSLLSLEGHLKSRGLLLPSQGVQGP